MPEKIVLGWKRDGKSFPDEPAHPAWTHIDQLSPPPGPFCSGLVPTGIQGHMVQLKESEHGGEWLGPATRRGEGNAKHCPRPSDSVGSCNWSGGRISKRFRAAMGKTASVKNSIFSLMAANERDMWARIELFKPCIQLGKGRKGRFM